MVSGQWSHRMCTMMAMAVSAVATPAVLPVGSCRTLLLLLPLLLQPDHRFFDEHSLEAPRCHTVSPLQPVLGEKLLRCLAPLPFRLLVLKPLLLKNPAVWHPRHLSPVGTSTDESCGP